MSGGLRLVDLGRVSGLHSQTTWHAVAEAMQENDGPVLGIMTPADPYVSIGYHRSIREIDTEACERRGLPVYRRRIGGGPVLCDDGQLFFQLVVPAASFPQMMDRAWATAMAPAVEAFRALGIGAEFVEGNDIAAEGRKISGLGAARIGDALVFAGNVIFAFDYDAMAGCLRIPPGAKEEVARLMRRELMTAGAMAGREVGREEARDALVAAYGAAFGGIEPGEMTERERRARDRLDTLFVSRDWVWGDRPAPPPRVKIRSGVSVLVLGRSWVSVVDGCVERASFPGGWVPAPGMESQLEEALAGLPLDRAALAGAARRLCGDRADDLVGAIMDAYRGGS